MRRGGKYYNFLYKHVFLFAQALHMKFNVSLQHARDQKGIFCFKAAPWDDINFRF